MKQTQDLFEDIDTDGSGGVSLEELTAGLTKQGYNLSQNEIEQLVRVAWAFVFEAAVSMRCVLSTAAAFLTQLCFSASFTLHTMRAAARH